MPVLTIRQILARKGDSLQLEIVAGEEGLDREVRVPEVSSPGLVLAGYTQRFMPERLHVLGETEVNYLRSLTPSDRTRTLERFMSFELPCVFVMKSQPVPRELSRLAKERAIPIIRSKLKTSEFYRRLTPYLTEMFAPAVQMHASMADVYGVGLLFIGRSGIGKSECVLDLVERGHRLVADDVVHVTRRGGDVLIGKAHEKRIEVVVELQDWDVARETERTGLDGRTTSILGVELPLVVIPLNPGKNLTVIIEVVAMNHLLRYSGVDAAREFNERLIKRMAEQVELREYLAEDYE
jgi:HPr kinase/phosphorylase